MDRRRLQVAFFQYALLKVAAWYPNHVSINCLHLHEGLSETLMNMTPQFHKAFMDHYSGQSSVAIYKTEWCVMCVMCEGLFSMC